ncbi:Hypothetical protein PHPALM_6035 [Phytophthora palmivora]|uniref:Uncharacterized protein n=1 Tax=Phytophthora palmivora TaxID=4796 RepID=A0A2P4YFX3_9STRA|nr:Hypothetical protein PHPALM_6035 [Phytophthora palmivora]
MSKVNDRKRFVREVVAVLAITTLEEEDKQDIKNEKQLLFSKVKDLSEVCYLCSRPAVLFLENVLVEFND